MKVSLYFYRFQLEGLPKLLLKIARDHIFSEDSQQGFIIDSNETDDVRVRYIYKERVTEAVENPFGEMIPVERIRYDVSHLSIRNDPNAIEICQPGRKFSHCLKFLTDQWSSDPVKLTPNFDRLFESLTAMDRNFAVLALETTSFTIKSRTACRVGFQALVDVRDDVQFFLSNRNFQIRTIRARLHVREQEVIIEVSHTGRTVVHFDPFLSVYHPLLKTVIDSMSSGSHPRKD